MFVGFLQQPGSGPYFLGHWDPEELSSLHSSPSPIHRHPFSSNTSPTDPTEPNSNNAEADFCCCESQDVDRGVVDCNASVSGGLKRAQSLALNPEEDHIESSQKDLRKSTNGLQNHIKPEADKVTNITDARGNQFNVKLPGTAGTLCKLAEDKHFTGSAEKHSNFSHQREKRGSSSDSWLSSPELGDKKPDSNRVTTHNNNHIRLKKSENKGATSPPAQASKYARPVCFTQFIFHLLIFLFCICRDAAVCSVQPHRRAEHLPEVLLPQSATSSANGGGANHGPGCKLARPHDSTFYLRSTPR